VSEVRRSCDKQKEKNGQFGSGSHSAKVQILLDKRPKELI
jgi:hypothetical protein